MRNSSPRIMAKASLAVCVLASILAMAPTASAATVVKLKGPDEIRQGEPIKVVATIENTAATSQTIDVTFALRAIEGGGPEVAFHRWAGSVPGNGDIDVTVTVTTSQYLAPLGAYKMTAAQSGILVGKPLNFTVKKSTLRVPKFQDVSETSGLSVTRPDYICGEWASGSAWGDIEGDGDLDMFVGTHGGASQLFVNDGSGHFTDQAADRGATNGNGSSSGGVFADYDNDGDQDLYVVNNGANKLLQNDGTGHFTDVGVEAGVADPLSGQSASWGDYDNDGFLDLYVVNYAVCDGTSTFTYHLDKLYHNEGDGTFSDQTTLIEKDPTTTADGGTIGAGFQSTWFDYDKDGDVDLFLANDFHGNRPDANHMWRNDGLGADGKWLFTDVSVASDTGAKMNTMGVAVGDYDRDQDLDFALSNIDAQKLMRNNGNGTFTDVAEFARVDRPLVLTNKSITWGLVFYDLNLDGWEDLYVAGGSLKTNPDAQFNEVLVNNKKGRFNDLSAPSRADTAAISRGVAAADYDNDGRIDVFVTNQAGRSNFYRNVTSKKNRNWLRVDTIGTASNRDGCGAWLTLRSSNGTQVRQVFCGSTSLASGNDSRVHFGLGSADKVDQLVIEWPSGATQTLNNLKVNRTISVTEG